MKLLSIDVGIKNLACCILDISGEVFNIYKWDIINLCNEDEEQLCSCTNKNMKKCRNIAKYYKNDIYYCLKHAKDKKVPLESKELNRTNINKKKLSSLIQLCQDYNIKISNKHKKVDIVGEIHNFVRDNCLQVIYKNNANDINLIDIGKNINTQLTKYYNDDKIDIVLIENQISPIANRMKTIQGMIAQYFIVKNIDDIHFVSSINKLKEFKLGKLDYKKRKERSIEITRELINNREIALKTFDGHKKKDDLADCFLQGYWFLKNKVFSAKNLKI